MEKIRFNLRFDPEAFPELWEILKEIPEKSRGRRLITLAYAQALGLSTVCAVNVEPQGASEKKGQVGEIQNNEPSAENNTKPNYANIGTGLKNF